MIRVAFPIYKGWAGGLNYIKNLLFAISKLDQRRIEPFVMAGYETDPALPAMYEPYARIIRSRMFDDKSLPWLCHMAQRRLFGLDTQLNHLIRKHDISILSHYSSGLKRNPHYRTVGWIPDFQHLHLPDMFSAAEIVRRNKRYSEIAARSDIVVLSSMDACNDFHRFAPSHVSKARILHFVAQPDMRPSLEVNRDTIEKKFGFRGKFFYLPNQFWKHKNHLTVFEAVRRLKQQGRQITLLCSGYMDDFRNRGHIEELVEFVNRNNLGEQIVFLGMIDSGDLTWLMRNGIAIINPSLFEGWSTTVEEAKSIGKGMILSDLPVHREQNPPQSVYFDPRNSDRLAELLWDAWNAGEGSPDVEMEARATAGLEGRTLAFARTYQDIVLEVAEGIRR